MSKGSSDRERIGVRHPVSRLHAGSFDHSLFGRRVEIQQPAQFAHDVARAVSTRTSFDHVRDLTNVDPAHHGTAHECFLHAAGRWLLTLQPSEHSPRIETLRHRSRSARCSAASSERRPRPAKLPRRLVCSRTGSTRTPAPSREKSTSSPGAIPRRSRIDFGITTCPLGPTREVIPTSITFCKHPLWRAQSRPGLAALPLISRSGRDIRAPRASAAAARRPGGPPRTNR